LKKEQYLDPVPELDSTGESDSQDLNFVKPRLITTHSENALTVFANGHHKPVHRNNHMAQKCGVPYKIPRPHTVHGHHELARRSVDSLPMQTPLETIHTTPTMIEKETIGGVLPELRMVRSENGSPHLTNAPALDDYRYEDLNATMPPLDLNFSDYGFSNRSQPDLHSVTSAPYDPFYCATPDTDQPIMSAGLDAPSVDWSHFDLPINHNAFSSSYNQPPSYASFDYRNFGPPPFSNASSVEPSEHGDCLPVRQPSPVPPPGLVHNRFPSDSSEVCETESYRVSGTSSFQGLSQMSLLASGNLESLDIDDYINATSASPFIPPTTTTTTTAAIESPKVDMIIRPSFSGSVDRFPSIGGSPPPSAQHKPGPTSAPAISSADDNDAYIGTALSSFLHDKPSPVVSAQAMRSTPSAPTSIARDDVSFTSTPIIDDPSGDEFWSYDLANLDPLSDVASGQDLWSS
jgi:hypothetical protein